VPPGAETAGRALPMPPEIRLEVEIASGQYRDYADMIRRVVLYLLHPKPAKE